MTRVGYYKLHHIVTRVGYSELIIPMRLTPAAIAISVALTTAFFSGAARAQSSRASATRSAGASAPQVPGEESTPPRLMRLVEATYPPEALRRGEGAVVVLLIELDASGQVTGVRVAESSGNSAFDEAAVAAARDFEFEPARRGGRAVPSRVRYRYRFTPPAPRATDEDGPRPTPSAGGVLTSTEASGLSSRAPIAPSRVRTSRRALQSEQGVTVYSRAPSREIGRREFGAEDIRRIPGARGDALLAIQNLPGVARPPFGIGQFIVRSSAPEDSLVTLEGQPIVLPFHFGGFASTIATDLIERIEFLPGNFSARYGRVAGGVINVTLRAPPRDRFHTAIDIDLIDAGAYASVPIGRTASVAIGARRSFVDLIAGPFLSGDSGGTSFRQFPFYWDYQLALDWDIGPRDSLRVVASGNDDQLTLHFRDPNSNDPNFRGNLGTHLAYHGLQARWRHRFGPDVVHSFAPAIAYNLTFGQLGPEVRFSFQSVVFNLRDELEVRLSRHARIFFGLDSQYGYLDNVVRAPPLPTNGIQDPIDPATVVSYADQRSFFNPASYVDAEIDATRALRILAGVRLDHFGLLNATTVNPRSMLRLALGDRIAARAGYGIYSTPPRGYYIVPGFGNPALRPESWQHITAGVNIQIFPGAVEFDTDLFIKLGDQVVAPSARTIVRDGQQVPERFANTGYGTVIGGEWMIRVRPGRAAPIYGLISYTFQRATRAACASCPFVTYTYDQPHILSAVLGAILPYGWEIGARARYTSGIVEPNVTGALYDADHDVSLTLTNPLAPGRLPPYFSLDLRVSKRFQLGPLRCQGILEVLNATNNNNPESRIYSYDRRESRLIYGLPIIPSLGIRAEY